VEYVPALHRVHTVLPVFISYVPGVQFRQENCIAIPRAVLKVPIAQLEQFRADIKPTPVPYVPELHKLQVVDAMAVEYFPVTQREQLYMDIAPERVVKLPAKH